MRQRVEADVRDTMHQHAGELLSPSQVAGLTGHQRTSVSGVLRRLAARPGERIKAEARGSYRYGRAEAEKPKPLAIGTLLVVVGDSEAGQLARDETDRVWVLRPVK